MQRKQPAIYIMSNAAHTVLYIGVISNLEKRAYEHRTGVIEGFTKRYHCKQPVYYEVGKTMEQMIRREKRLKKYRRKDKELLIAKLNPEWEDLYPKIL